MPAMQIPIVRGEATDASTDYIDFLPKNLYAVPKQVRGDSSYLISHDGLKLLANFTENFGFQKDRGGFYNERQGKHFRVINSALVILDPNGALNKVIDIPGVEQASFAYSFNSTLILAEKRGWRYLDDGSIVEYTDPDFKSAIDATWTAGYYVFTDGEYLFHTDINNEAAIDSLQYATAEVSPDGTLGLLTTQDDLLMVFGRYTIQYFYNAATPQFAFSNIAQKAINAGIVGTHAKTMLLGDVFILGGRKNESPSFYIVGGGDIKPIATRTIDKIIAQYTDAELSGTILESRVDERMAFMIARLERHTLVFNYTYAQAGGLDNAWSVLSTGVDNGIWLGANGVFDPVIRKWVYGSSSSGKVFTLDKIDAAHDGQPVESEFQTPILPMPYARLSKAEVNTVTGMSQAPQSVFISISTDMIGFNTEWIKMLPTRATYGGRYIVNRIGFVPDEITIKVRSLSLGKINFSSMVLYSA
jgi:hypothetical protein